MYYSQYTMPRDNLVQLSIYVKPDTAETLRKHVVMQTGSMRSLSPWLKDAIFTKAKAEGLEINED